MSDAPSDAEVLQALRPPGPLARVFAPRPDAVVVRWLFLRAFGAILLSAFLPLAFEIHGMLGEDGILPARLYLREARALGWSRFWQVPTLLWLHAGDAAMTGLWVLGLCASLAVVLNLWPRLSIAVAALAFLSFVSVADDFAHFQSDGMLLQASVAAFFLAPRG